VDPVDPDPDPQHWFKGDFLCYYWQFTLCFTRHIDVGTVALNEQGSTEQLSFAHTNVAKYFIRFLKIMVFGVKSNGETSNCVMKGIHWSVFVANSRKKSEKLYLACTVRTVQGVHKTGVAS
jgi:hypothetical protein